MVHPAAYFDAIMFGRLLLAALLIVDPTASRDTAPDRLAALVRERTGFTADPGEIEMILSGDAPCTVPLMAAVIETLEPPRGFGWFSESLASSTDAHLWRLRKEQMSA